ncbi:MAG: DUF2812 domain-containing protein [Oscillibacter sp.]|nr:DUF2812 domain-containing protein [Oscillibacter sp.]
MSRDKKRQLIWYQIDDTETIAHHLEKMAAKGWLLEEADNWWYTYRRAKPAQVRYTATFFPDASVFDAGPTAGQETYIDYCRAAGWELAAVYGPIQYFRSTRPDPVPIETDEAVKLAAVRRTMRKTFVFSYALLLLLPAVNLPLMWKQFQWDPLDFLCSNSKLATVALMTGIIIFVAGMLLDYLIWVLRSRYSVAHGGTCRRPHTRFRMWFNAGMLALCAAVLLGYFMNLAGLRATLMIYLVIYGGIMLLSRWVLRRLKRSGASRGDIRGLFIVFAIVAGLVVGFATPFLFARLAGAGIIYKDREPAESYTYTSRDFSFTRGIYRDKLPLTLEDLGYTVTEDDHCSYRAEISRSPLAVHSEYTQEAMNLDSDLPRLYYQTYDSRWSWMLEKCWEELTRAEEDDPWPMRELTPAPWGAEEACRREGLTSYFLLYPDRIVTFSLGEDASPRQLDVIIQALQP